MAIKATAFLQLLLPEGAAGRKYPYWVYQGNDTAVRFERWLREAGYEALEELENLSGMLEFELGLYGVYRPEIVRVPVPEEEYDPDDDYWFYDYDGPETGDGRRYEILTVSVALPGYLHDDYHKDRAKLEGLKALLEKRVYDLMLAVNMARPGALELGQGTIILNDEERREPGHQLGEMGKGHLLQGAWRISRSLGWPEIKILGIRQVWEWANQQEGFSEGFGGGPTGRALNAFARRFGSNGQDDAANLLWALVGIEALYTEGQGSLQQQVNEKSQAFLGEMTQHKKKINRMYDFRSRFVHGDLDFSGKLVVGDAAEDYQRHNHELRETVIFAEAILVATLQRLVELGWRGVRFPRELRVEGLP